MIQLIPLALASSLWPALLAVVLVSLRASHPGRLMGSFLAAGLLTTVTIGYWVVTALKDSKLNLGSRGSFQPGLQITIGCLAVLAAFVLRARSRRRAAAPAPVEPERAPDPGRIERMLDRGAPLAFVAGILFNIVPGVVPFVALGQIAELDEGTAGTIALLVGFYVIMFWLIEVPLAGYAVAPTPTADLTKRFNAWLDRNGGRLARAALALIGLYLIVIGLIGAL